MGSCWRARPAPAQSAGRCWSPSACGPTAGRRFIDFRLAQTESAAEWERFLGDLIRRGLLGEGLEMICADGGSGILVALPTAFPGIPIQRCWAHKIRNVLDKVRKVEQPAVKADLHAVMNARTLWQARSAARRFADHWHPKYPKTVACLRDYFDELLACWRYKSLGERNVTRSSLILAALGWVRQAGAAGYRETIPNCTGRKQRR
jgi:putative transposase